MRVAFRGAGPRFPQGLAAMQAAFASLVQRFAMAARISDRAAKPRFVIPVSQGSLCLNDLLPRLSTGTHAIGIVPLISNTESQPRLTAVHTDRLHHTPPD